MTAVEKIESIDWALLGVALGVLLLMVCVLCLLLIKDNRKKQTIYKHFGNHLSEGIIVLKKKLDYLYSIPLFIEDPLFKKLIHGENLSDILDPKERLRIKSFFEESEKRENIPFLFSLKTEEGKVEWYEILSLTQNISETDFNYVCFVKNISKEQEIRREKKSVQNNVDLILKSTKAFLWSLNIETRLIKILSPISEETDMIPQYSSGIELNQLMLEEDAQLFNQFINKFIVDYKPNINFNENKNNPPIKVRLKTFYENKCWYNFYGLFDYDRSGSLIIRGVASPINIELEDYIFENNQALFSATMLLPDLRIFWVDKNYKILGANQAFANDFKIVDIKEIKGKKITKVASEKYQLYFNQILSQVFETKKNVSWKNIKESTDEFMIFNATPLKIESDNISQVLCLYFNVKMSV